MEGEEGREGLCWWTRAWSFICSLEVLLLSSSFPSFPSFCTNEEEAEPATEDEDKDEEEDVDEEEEELTKHTPLLLLLATDTNLDAGKPNI